MQKRIICLALTAAMLGAGAWAAEAGKGGKNKNHWGQQKQERQAHRQQMREETKAFQASLKGLSESERLQAMQEYSEARYQKNLTFNAQQYQENMARLKANMAANAKLSDAQQAEIMACFEKQHLENTEFNAQRHAANQAFMQALMQDSSLTPEQRRQKIKEHRRADAAERKAHREQQQAARKTCLGKACPASADCQTDGRPRKKGGSKGRPAGQQAEE